jgi:hypothetical protein
MTDLTQAEADALLAMAKRASDATVYRLPLSGGKLSIPLESLDGKEAFTLDATRGRINVLKGTYQHRGRSVVVLARLDFGGAPHRNPDDVEVATPHIHLYREGFGDKWAYPLPPEHFHDSESRSDLLNAFLRHCNIVEPPQFDRDLFE